MREFIYITETEEFRNIIEEAALSHQCENSYIKRKELVDYLRYIEEDDGPVALNQRDVAILKKAIEFLDHHHIGVILFDRTS